MPTQQFVTLALLTTLTTAAETATPAPAAGAAWPSWRPDAAFVQGGVARDARTLVAGVTWWSDWERPLASGRLRLYWEASLGRWEVDAAGQPRSYAWVTQIGVTPVLRWTPAAAEAAWFAEAGVGANVLLPLYRSREKRFSTAFNFGDHIAVGRRFGSAGQHELALRLQHFSNAGIKKPNPGEDFLQLRYAFRY